MCTQKTTKHSTSQHYYQQGWFVNIPEHNNSATSQVCVGYHAPCMCSCSSHNLALHCRTPTLPWLLVVVRRVTETVFFVPVENSHTICIDWAALTMHETRVQHDVGCILRRWLLPDTFRAGYIFVHRFPAMALGSRSGPSSSAPPHARSGPLWRAATLAHLTSSVQKKFILRLTLPCLTEILQKDCILLSGGSLQHRVLLQVWFLRQRNANLPSSKGMFRCQDGASMDVSPPISSYCKQGRCSSRIATWKGSWFEDAYA